MYEIEKEYIDSGMRYIVGIDEVGRGPLLGDVVTAAVCIDFKKLNDKGEIDFIKGIKDSKKITSSRKRKLFSNQIKEACVDYAITSEPPEIIDKINIYQATKKSMEKSLAVILIKLEKKGITPDIVLVDAMKIDGAVRCEALKKADDLCYTVSCASILAKVYRDEMCKEWDKKYPGYEIKNHKGYATKSHREALIRMGPCEIHRKSFLNNLEKWKDQSKIIGDSGEDKAAFYLQERGYEIIDRNYKNETGEIDIIAIKGIYLVFIEVKTRKNSDFGYGYEAVDERKQKKIKSTANYFYYFGDYLNYQPRFDVIEIYTETNIINHYEDAFN